MKSIAILLLILAAPAQGYYIFTVQDLREWVAVGEAGEAGASLYMAGIMDQYALTELSFAETEARRELINFCLDFHSPERLIEIILFRSAEASLVVTEFYLIQEGCHALNYKYIGDSE